MTQENKDILLKLLKQHKRSRGHGGVHELHGTPALPASKI